MHYETLLKAESLGGSFFIEKPVFHSSFVAPGIPRSLRGRTIHVACPLRFHPIIELFLKSPPARKGLCGPPALLLLSARLAEGQGLSDRLQLLERRELGGKE